MNKPQILAPTDALTGTVPRHAAESGTPPAPRHQLVRVRHALRRRVLTVATREQRTPAMLRLVFTSPDLADFVSASADDHIKLFIPAGDTPVGERPVMRDFTPRSFDLELGTITIDFALHDAGPATDWARRAAPGDRIEIGGPRGSTIIPDDFDWMLLIADDTGLPAIGRRLDELRPDLFVIVVGLVDGAAEEQPFTARASMSLHWVHREGRPGNDPAPLLARLSGLTLPPGDGFVWIAAEADVARASRQKLIGLGHPPQWIKAAGYWQAGAADVHTNIE